MGGGCDGRKGEVRKDELITVTTSRLHFSGGGGVSLPSSKIQDAFVYIHFYVRTIFVREKRDGLLWVCGTVQVGGQLYSPGRGWYKEVSDAITQKRTTTEYTGGQSGHF